MRHSLIVVLVLLCACIAQELKTHDEKSDVHKKAAQPSTQDSKQEPTSNPNGIGKCVGCFSVNEIEPKSKQGDGYDAGHDTLYRVYLVLTIIGVVGAWFGILAIFRQTKATTQAAQSSAESAAAAARSAKAAEDSVRLQQAAFRQWVDIKDWTLGQFGDDMFRLDFNVINPTDKPLRLDLVVTDIEEEKGTTEAVANFLIPQRPYRISRLIEYTDEQKRQREVGTLVLTIGCSMFFTDAANVQWEQSMEFWLTFGKDNPWPLAMTEVRIRLRYSGVDTRIN